MPYTPKFHTGETVEVIADDGSIGFQVIVIGSWVSMLPYFRGISDDNDYDERDEFHTLYASFCPTRQRFWWYWERDFDGVAYCTNTDKGKGILKNNLQRILDEYRIRDGQMEEFLDKFIRTTPHERIDSVNPVNPMPQAVSDALDSSSMDDILCA